ncbi:small GTP-binding [Chlorella sorokiniana]|uniref:Small GTP-binding n=1 Tax=Chlorella sorokiniana TaxID=3076 RepID=A0A2P6TGN9_CHLSO|nr:small GTP-binding [Chlorella sorokiniana]|eukprot:PRW33266.1 small GTP-binding [Chlorella sorokiniana]
MAAVDSETPFSSLQRELVVHILSKLGQAELHRAALVNRFFRSCVDSPSLCREREVCIRGGSPAGLQRRKQQVLSLTHWLASHGQHLRSLRIKDAGILPPEDTMLLQQCALAAGSLCTQLELLSIHFQAAAVDPGWAAPLTALRRLALFSGTVLLPPSGLETLQRCTQLALYGRQSGIDQATRLPPNLQELTLGALQGGELPSQLAALTALHTLELWGDWRGTSTLSQLSSLRHLHITGPGLVPWELSTLTGLESLLVAYDKHSVPLWPLTDENSQRLKDACLRLTCLTSLALCVLRGTELPDEEMAGLTQLQRFYASRSQWELGELPPGPWLASLTCLAADATAVLHSTDLLAGATALTRLTLVDIPGGESDDDSEQPSSYQEMRPNVAALYDWAAGQRTLRRITFVGDRPNAIDVDIFRGALALKAARPDIEMDAYPAGREPTFAREFHYHGIDDLVPGWREAIALTEPYAY